VGKICLTLTSVEKEKRDIRSACLSYTWYLKEDSWGLPGDIEVLASQLSL